MPVERFRSKAAYMRNLAYRHIHGIPMTAKTVCIDGKCHAVDHADSPKSRKRIDAKQKRKARGITVRHASGHMGKYTHGSKARKRSARKR